MYRKNINGFIDDLLHINDLDKNKLIDLYGGNPLKTFILSYDKIENLSKYVLNLINERIGKPGNTVLRGSSMLSSAEQVLGQRLNALDWAFVNGTKNPEDLKDFINEVYKELSLKGNNPVFLSVGSLKYNVVNNKNEICEVNSPILIFPIRLVRSESVNTPVYIEFVNDDLFVNPCLISKLRHTFGNMLTSEFPHPNGEGVDIEDEFTLTSLKDGEEYFEKLQAFVNNQKSNKHGSNTLFELNKNLIAISQYNHNEICMYYDIRKNRDRVYDNKLISRIFNKCESPTEQVSQTVQPNLIYQRDSVQDRIIRRVVNGESLIVKGPPGTGKTLTITNMIASLLAENKSVMLSSSKLAAMEEVYNKLPDKLRKFVMLLDSETETQASKLNPVEVKKDLSNLLNTAKNYTAKNNLYSQRTLAKTNKTNATRCLVDYANHTFLETDVLGDSLYNALEKYFEVSEEPIAFDTPRNAYRLKKLEFDNLISKVELASNYFKVICNDHEFYKSPLMPLSKDLQGVNLENVLEFNKNLSSSVESLLSALKELLLDNYDKYSSLRLYTLKVLSENEISKEEFEFIKDNVNEKTASEIYRNLKDYLFNDKCVNGITFSNENEFENVYNVIKTLNYDDSLKKSDCALIQNSQGALSVALNQAKVSKLTIEFNEIKSLENQKDVEFIRFYNVFRKDISKEDYDYLYLNSAQFSKYDGKGKPSLFDFFTKKAYAKLSTLGYGEEIDFASIVSACKALDNVKLIEAKIKTCYVEINRLFGTIATKDELDAISLIIFNAYDKNLSVEEYAKNLKNSVGVLLKAFDYVSCSEDYTFKDVILSYETKLRLDKLLSSVKPFITSEQGDPIVVANKIISVYDLVSSRLFLTNEETLDFINYVNNSNLNDKINLVYSKLNAFKSNYYETYFTSSFKALISDFELILTESTNRNVLNAVTGYLAVVNSPLPLSVDKFFNPYEFGLRNAKTVSIVEQFKHSVYKLAIEYKLQNGNLSRNGIGAQVEKQLQDVNLANEEIFATNVDIIESQCLSRIYNLNENFAFLSAERSNNQSLRKLFKGYAKEILALKKCFILSPASVSVLLQSKDYFDFDVAIIDEASQLEPIEVIPILLRAKQVVIVGDEWQMPPIKHFTSSLQKYVTDVDGEYEILDPNTSVLSLALSNASFSVEQFLCHYRSKTESLISFSRNRFYEFMRTFPASNPSASWLGFKDVFVENATCLQGVNLLEAQAVCSELNTFFNEFYNETSGVLQNSVGIVAFGKEQLDVILGCVKKDVVLSNKISTALRNFNDQPEKLIFFKTIETVQGRETDHLILSLTYGKDKNGKTVQRFGELNRGDSTNKIGQCIFNVAVTRAKSSVTLVHSINYDEIDNENVKYLAEYLETVKRFSVSGKSQFVGDSIDSSTAFIKQIANYLVSLGISNERIVINYGVNESSVKIPIAILSKDLSFAEVGLWCEMPLVKKYDFFDYNLEYFNSLTNRGWKLTRVFAQDWYDNTKSEMEKLKSFVNSNVKI